MPPPTRSGHGSSGRSATMDCRLPSAPITARRSPPARWVVCRGSALNRREATSACLARSNTRVPSHREFACAAGRLRTLSNRVQRGASACSLGPPPARAVLPASPRQYPSKVPEIHYPQGFIVRRVGYAGTIKWKGGFLRISNIRAGGAGGLVSNRRGQLDRVLRTNRARKARRPLRSRRA
jgi:hypothetical protein